MTMVLLVMTIVITRIANGTIVIVRIIFKNAPISDVVQTGQLWTIGYPFTLNVNQRRIPGGGGGGGGGLQPTLSNP